MNETIWKWNALERLNEWSMISTIHVKSKNQVLFERVLEVGGFDDERLARRHGQLTAQR